MAIEIGEEKAKQAQSQIGNAKKMIESQSPKMPVRPTTLAGGQPSKVSARAMRAMGARRMNMK